MLAVLAAYVGVLPTPVQQLAHDTVAAPGVPPVDPAAQQAFVTAVLEANGKFAVGIEAIRLDSACAAQHFVP